MESFSSGRTIAHNVCTFFIIKDTYLFFQAFFFFFFLFAECRHDNVKKLEETRQLKTVHTLGGNNII